MSKPTFLIYEKPLLTVMVQAEHPDRIRELMDRSLPCGAEAFGMQFCKLKEEFRNPAVYRSLFAHAGEKPVYVTNYRTGVNQGKSDETLAKELIELAECGATLCDVMADYFDHQPGEFTMDETAVQKQISLIEKLHEKSAEVLMSTHILKFTPAERVLEIALEQQRRGADICKIVVGADTMAEQIENLRILHLLKENLRIPFLFLSGGQCHLLRRIGGTLGCCMSLCVYEYDELATKAQPLLTDMKRIRDDLEDTGL